MADSLLDERGGESDMTSARTDGVWHGMLIHGDSWRNEKMEVFSSMSDVAMDGKRTWETDAGGDDHVQMNNKSILVSTRGLTPFSRAAEA